jgi:hypothetical protein
VEQVKHTKGPWGVNPVNAQVDAFATGEPLPICQLLWPTDERSEAETFANARLIAAAPDLLAELEWVRKGLEQLRHMKGLRSSSEALIARIDAVIARATGGR